MLTKYVNNAIMFLCTAVILVLCIGSYLGANTIEDISKAIVEALPFGAYLWEIYSLYFDSQYAENTVQTFTQSAIITIKDFIGELVKLVIAWFAYRLVIRNAVSVLMVAYCNGSE